MNVIAGAAAGDTYARFRLSSTGALTPTGPANDGEVEDYKVLVQAPVDPNLVAVMFKSICQPQLYPISSDCATIYNGLLNSGLHNALVQVPFVIFSFACGAYVVVLMLRLHVYV